MHSPIEYLSVDVYFVLLTNGSCIYVFRSQRGAEFILYLPVETLELVFRSALKEVRGELCSFVEDFNPEEEE